MRLLALVVLMAITLVVAGWTELGWNPKGRAVVKTQDGMSHVIRQSWCGGRLRFGGTAINSDEPYMSLVVEAREGRPAVLDIIDGVLRLAPESTIAVLGTAHVQVAPRKRGTFVLFRHEGGGVLGKPRYTGKWTCG
jgi:hypothetical protein